MVASSMIVRKIKKKAQLESEARMKLTSENITDKKYSLFHRGVCIFNWNDLRFIHKWMTSLGSGPSTFIHYNEPGLEAYTEAKTQ